MHKATIQALAGYCQVIRQCLIGLEAVVAAEGSDGPAQAVAQQRMNNTAAGTDSLFTTENEDDIVGKILGLDGVTE